MLGLKTAVKIGTYTVFTQKSSIMYALEMNQLRKTYAGGFKR